MDKPLKGKITVISGASRGIGKAIALKLAGQGSDIVVNYVRNDEAAKATVSAIEALGQKAVMVQGNIADPKTMDEIFETTVSTFGKLDILIHSAALGAFKPVHKLKMNHWDLSLDINAKAFLQLTQKAIPLFEKNGGGNILTLSSLGSQKFIPDYGAIGISKAALENLVRYLAVELASKNIRVNCVSGGLIDTDALKSFPDYEKLKAEALKRTPMGRIGKADDIANIIAFLAGDESGWIVGQTIIADGGLSLIS